MDLTKSMEYFNPNQVQKHIHIIGCGSVGSTVAENLVRCGITKLVLWDFDTVEEHNLVNQMFRACDVGKNKAEALLDILCEINPDVRHTTKLRTAGWKDENLGGYVFLCVDSIDLRRKIVEQHLNNPLVDAVFDFRTRLEEAQHFAARWSEEPQRNKLLSTMQFTDEEADADTPVSACGVALGVVTTVRLICAYGVSNFINLVKGEPIANYISADAFKFGIMKFME